MESNIFPAVAALNPLSQEDLASLMAVVEKCTQLSQLIDKAISIGLPVDESKARNDVALQIAQKTITTFFPQSPEAAYINQNAEKAVQ